VKSKRPEQDQEKASFTMFSYQPGNGVEATFEAAKGKAIVQAALQNYHYQLSLREP
jgi:hypothetical protein